MYNLLHKEQLHVSALFIDRLQVDKWDARSRTHSTPDSSTVYKPHKSSVAAYQCFSFINLKMANEKGRNMWLFFM